MKRRRCDTDTTNSKLLLQKIAGKIKKAPLDFTASEDYYYIARELKVHEPDYAFDALKSFAGYFEKLVPRIWDDGLVRDFYDLHKRVLLEVAQRDFESYLLYVEWERDPAKKFYVPRRKQLSPLVKAMQDLADDKLDLLTVSLPPGVGKSTLGIFFMTWLGGNNPNKPMLGGSHSNSFLRGVYDEVLRILEGNGGEYLWRDVFPEIKISGTNAKDMRVDLDKSQRFETFEFSSIGSGNAGKVRAETLLYCDDLVDGLETALSKERLEKLWQQYTTDLRQRKIGACKELHIATRWSVHDVIGRLEAKYGDSDRARFIVCPAMDENDESNFDYPCEAGFTTQFYREQRDIMDDVSWRALYMNQPIEREGLLYSEDELRRYFELPDREPDAILACVDTKDRGTDYCAMPIVYRYGNDYYVEGILCDNSNPEIVETRLVAMLLAHKVDMARFESNSAGGRIAEKVQKEVKANGGKTRITTKYTTANKETKIILNSPFVKENFLFKDDSVAKKDKEYMKAMRMLCGYTMMGKNKNDDVPDAFAQLAEFIQSFERGQVEIFKRPF